MGHISRFGHRPASDLAASETDLDDDFLPAPAPIPPKIAGSISYGGYHGFGERIILKPCLSAWQGIMTPENPLQERNRFCAFGSKAQNSLHNQNTRLLNKIRDLIAVLRDGVISPYGSPYISMTPMTPSDTIPATLSRKGKPAKPSKPLLTVGFDAEWCEDGDQRKILSYQFALPVAGLPDTWFVSVYMIGESGRRFSLGRLLGHFLRSANVAGALAPPLPKFRPRKKRAVSALTVTLAGHYSIVDITTLFKGAQMLRRLDTIRRSEVSVERPLSISLIDHHRHVLPVTVFLRDSLMLTAAGTPLANVGQAIGLPKVDLPEGFEKSAMDVLRRDRPDAFIVYSAVDAVITLEWLRQIEKFAAEHAPDRRGTVAPPTTGSLSASMTRAAIMKALKIKSVEDFDFTWRGLVTNREQEMDENGILKTVKKVEPGPALQITESLWRAAFLGGRNECLAHGLHTPRKSDRWWDWDVKNAYVAAMALVRDIDWSAMPKPMMPGVLRHGDLAPLDYFVGYVRFKFPSDTPAPCIPVKDNCGRGLIYPLEGECVATAPEICLALDLGAEIEMISGHIHPVRPGPGSLRHAVKVFISERAAAKEKHGKGSVQETLWKLLGNGTYGKTGQGLRDKRNYSTRSDSIESVPPSQITCAPYAAVITALVRALVSAAMADLMDHGYTVLSVTTDGFLTDADPEAMANMTAFGFVKIMSDARAEVTGENDTIWECKHAALKMVMSRTRAGFGIGKIKGYNLPAAAAGYIKQNIDVERIKGGEKLAEILAEKFVERDIYFGVNFTKLPSPKDYVRNKADGIGKMQFRKVDWNYDFKRMPDKNSFSENYIFGVPYISYLTVPHKNIEEFKKMREDHDNIKMILKSVENYSDFLDRHFSKKAASHAGVRRASIDAGGMRRTSAMHILRGIRAGIIKINKEIKSSEIRKIISDVFDIKISDNDWKNAARRHPENVLTAAMADRLAILSDALDIRDFVIFASVEDERAYISACRPIRAMGLNQARDHDHVAVLSSPLADLSADSSPAPAAVSAPVPASRPSPMPLLPSVSPPPAGVPFV